MTDTITLTKGTAPQALAALYNASQVQDMGIFQSVIGTMTELEAQAALDHSVYVDYLHGKVIKVGFETNELRLDLFNRDNGPGAAQVALEACGLEFTVLATQK